MAVKEGSSCRANAFLYELLVGVVITVTITNGVMGKKGIEMTGGDYFNRGISSY